MTFREQYPQAFEDNLQTIWVSEEAAKRADWTFAHGDAFLEDILGCSWAEAYENFALTQRINRRKRWIAKHRNLYKIGRWIRSRYYLMTMFLSLSRPSYELGPCLAWKLATDLWLDRP